ncbi:MAG: endonuclease [Deltaproteobacteria bacterium]|nr:endonuclease [Deltaproteobacteria bacterium]
MSRIAFQKALLSTLADGQISRSERKALRSLLDDEPLSDSSQASLRHELFLEVGSRLHDHRDRKLLAWLSDAIKLLERPEEGRDLPSPRVLFGPEDPMVETLVNLIEQTRETLDIAVFTLTDNRLKDALIHAYRRGVRVRILSDGDKAEDRGSDVWALKETGLEVRLDYSAAHFHHKFALFDGKAVVTGSYNWTRGADRDNRENFLVTWDPEVVRPYAGGFERLWGDSR